MVACAAVETTDTNQQVVEALAVPGEAQVCAVEEAAKTCEKCGRVRQKPCSLCTQCLGVAYCSADCQRIDWKERHKEMCGVTAAVMRVASAHRSQALGMALAIATMPKCDCIYTSIPTERLVTVNSSLSGSSILAVLPIIHKVLAPMGLMLHPAVPLSSLSPEDVDAINLARAKGAKPSRPNRTWPGFVEWGLRRAWKLGFWNVLVPHQDDRGGFRFLVYSLDDDAIKRHEKK
jgi:hypothetical protein